MVIQVIGAYYSNSLAVLADAGHLFVHNSSLFIALIASSLAIHFAKTYNDGYKRAEYTGGLINGILYLSIAVIILLEGSERLSHHAGGHDLEVNSYLMSMIAAIGIGIVVDDTIHFLHHFKRAFDVTQDVERAVRETLLTTGRALFITSMVLCGGFFIYMVGSLANNVRFGIISGTAVIFALLADFFLVPSLLSIVYPRKIHGVII